MVQKNSKDAAFRERALNGNMWILLLSIGGPLALYNGLGSFFKILDALMASHISAESVSAIAYLTQIQQMISAVGTGLAVGGSMKISEAYGAGDYHLVKKRVNTLYAIYIGLCIMVALLIPFSRQILILANTPENLLLEGQGYFAAELTALILTFFNTVYIAIERSRGHSKRILNLNLGMTVVKLGLTALFVYVLEMGIVMIGVATFISQGLITVYGVINMREKDTAFSVDIKEVSAEKKVLQPMLTVAYPVSIEKVAFGFGKVVVNSMSGLYGSSGIISQNLGAGNLKRVVEAFWKTLTINISIGAVGMIVSLAFLEQLTALFAMSQGGYNRVFQEMIIHIYQYDVVGSEAVGIMMLISNISTAITAFIIALVVIRRLKKRGI